ncbi:hypothetical protein EDB86DRAFT_3247036 [Lactarius hatsudake]|nr:hypothetical protein EDB86DRAFT_3247036 [Lactarius hatsudake]
MRLAPRCGKEEGKKSESTCGSGVGGGHWWDRWRSQSWQQTHTRLRKKNVWRLNLWRGKSSSRPKSPSPPLSPPCSTQARCHCLQPITTHKSAATTTPYSAQEPPQRHPHCYDTDDDSDAGEAGDDGDDATSRRAGSTTQQELSSSGGPRGCIRQWLHRHALVGSGGNSGAAVVTGAFVVEGWRNREESLQLPMGWCGWWWQTHVHCDKEERGVVKSKGPDHQIPMILLNATQVCWNRVLEDANENTHDKFGVMSCMR